MHWRAPADRAGRVRARDLSTLEEIGATATSIASAIKSRVPNTRIEVIDGFSQMGSGSLPGRDLPTCLVAIESADGNPEPLAKSLRLSSPPVFARIARGQLLIDPRTILPGEEPILIEAVVKALGVTA